MHATAYFNATLLLMNATGRRAEGGGSHRETHESQGRGFFVSIECTVEWCAHLQLVHIVQSTWETAMN